MLKKTLRLLVWAVLCLTVLSGGGWLRADTWHLREGQEWENVGEAADGKYLMAVAEVKRLISEGEVEGALEALEKVKELTPEIAGADLEAFIEAEKLYSEGEWLKAVKAYDEFLENHPESKLYESALEREYSIGVAFLNGEKRVMLKILKVRAYDEGAALMRKLAERTGDRPMAKRALVTLAKKYEERGEYYDAYETWAEISILWPTGNMREQSLLGQAESLHSAYKGPRYDHQSSLESARSYYQIYREQYTESAKEHEVDERLAMIDEQLAYKSFTIGQYYSRSGNIQAANLYYQMVIENWPETAASNQAAEAMATAGAEGEGEIKKPFARNVFDGVSGFLDSWFGLAGLTKSDSGASEGND
jgi:outer membrane protein assembly factor BamD (BamD/ComL family)